MELGTRTFNSFPVAAVVERAQLQLQLQLPFNSFPVAAGWIRAFRPTILLTAFNSFPVAAVTVKVAEQADLPYFQFFPSCCRESSGLLPYKPFFR
ncbi:MAG: hypothetical protein LM576_08910 [Thermofilum sp.]|nr:hypothetical protein [Thermofilum sp.]